MSLRRGFGCIGGVRLSNLVTAIPLHMWEQETPFKTRSMCTSKGMSGLASFVVLLGSISSSPETPVRSSSRKPPPGGPKKQKKRDRIWRCAHSFRPP